MLLAQFVKSRPEASYDYHSSCGIIIQLISIIKLSSVRRLNEILDNSMQAANCI